MMKSLKIIFVLTISITVLHSFDKALAANEIPHKPSTQEKTEDVKGTLVPPTAEQQKHLEEEMKKAKEKGAVKKSKKKKHKKQTKK